MKIIWSPLSLDKVGEISDNIGENNLEAGVKWLNQLFEKVESLQKFPQSGRIVPELNRKDIRELIFGNYRIIYRIDDDVIYILTIRHSKQILSSDNLVE